MFPEIVVPQIINSNRVFHCKPSILGYPYFWTDPNSDVPLCKKGSPGANSTSQGDCGMARSTSQRYLSSHFLSFFLPDVAAGSIPSGRRFQRVVVMSTPKIWRRWTHFDKHVPTGWQIGGKRTTSFDLFYCWISMLQTAVEKMQWKTQHQQDSWVEGGAQCQLYHGNLRGPPLNANFLPERSRPPFQSLWIIMNAASPSMEI